MKAINTIVDKVYMGTIFPSSRWNQLWISKHKLWSEGRDWIVQWSVYNQVKPCMHILSNRARLIMGLNDTNIYEGSMGFSHKFLGLTYWYMTGLGGGGGSSGHPNSPLHTSQLLYLDVLYLHTNRVDFYFINYCIASEWAN